MKACMWKILLWLVMQTCSGITAVLLPNSSHLYVKNAFTEFDELTDDSTYVDKSILIQKFIDRASTTPFQLFTCPSKFGKTSNLKMMRRFFELSAFADGSVLLNKTSSDAYKTFTDPYKRFAAGRLLEPGCLFFEHFFNNFVVIEVSFKIKNGTSFESILSNLRKNIKKCFEMFKWAYDLERVKPSSKSNNTLKNQIDFMERVYNGDTLLNETELVKSLSVLSEFLYNFFKFRGIFMLIDDYDDAIVKVIEHNVAEFSKVHCLIDSIFRSLFNTRNRYVRYAFITGTMNILDGSEFTNILHTRFSENNEFRNCFGLTDEEVDKVFQRNHVEQKQRFILKQYYEGYSTTVNSTKIYNPFSIDAITLCKKRNPDAVVENFWSDRCAIGEFFKAHQCKPTSRYVMSSLLDSETIKFTLKKAFTVEDLLQLREQTHTFVDISKFKSDLFWSFLFHHGYVTHADKPNLYRVPNIEVAAFLHGTFTAEQFA